MATLTPRLASEYSDAAYQLKDKQAGSFFRLKLSAESAKHFSFSESNGPLIGSSGGIFFRPKTGFAAVGRGISSTYKNDIVVIVRGTDTLADFVTDAHFGVQVSENGTAVHAGFNRTFASLRPALQEALDKQGAHRSGGVIHCTGHSLGGALAGLAADWIKSHYRRPVYLYTFGAPRVGMFDFSSQTTARVDKFHRCVHGADPVPMVPVWPYIHAPYSAQEYRLDPGIGISLAAHKMARSASPGYLNTANTSDWGSLQLRSATYLNSNVHLKYENRHQASFSTYWAERLSAALITLLKAGGKYHLIKAQAKIGTALTYYDLLAQTVEEIAKGAATLAEDTKGLLGHMLVFAGKGTNKAIELTYKFIRWVFEVTIKALNAVVKLALKNRD